MNTNIMRGFMLMLRNFSDGIIFTIQLFCTVDNNAAHMNTCYSM